MLDLSYDYATCINNSEKINWRVDDVIRPDARLDLTRPFLPSSLAADQLTVGLSDSERLVLNQITANAYANFFAFVEEYIIATTVDLAKAELRNDPIAARALLRFGEEEIKHQELFHRFMDLFARSFGCKCEVLNEAGAVAAVIASKSPIAVMLVTLQIEIMTQTHYTESIRNNATIDPLFASLLEHHWLEESQHARIDALQLDALATIAPPEQISAAFAEYLDLIDSVDELLEGQALMDVRTLARAIGRSFDAQRADAIARNQHRAYRNSFLVMGMQHRLFIDILRKLVGEEEAGKVADKASSLLE